MVSLRQARISDRPGNLLGEEENEKEREGERESSWGRYPSVRPSALSPVGNAFCKLTIWRLTHALSHPDKLVVNVCVRVRC